MALGQDRDDAKPRGARWQLGAWAAVAGLTLLVADLVGSGGHRAVEVRTDSSVPPASTPPGTTVALTTTVPRPTTTTPPTMADRATTTSTTRAPAPTTTAAPLRSAATTSSTTAGCPVNSASQLASTGGAQQLITVEAPAADTTVATVALWQRDGRCWEPAGGPWTGDIGYSGFSAHHREGDGSTPIGEYGISAQFYGNSPNPGVHGAYHQLACGDWWDEDPTTAAYNTFQHVACGQKPPFGGGSEALWTETTAYPSFAVVEYNTDPIVPYAGSAIFIHADVGGATDGCVSLPLGELDQLLQWLQPGEALIAMGPTSVIDGY